MTRAGLTYMPIMPWHGAPRAKGAPRGGRHYFSHQYQFGDCTLLSKNLNFFVSRFSWYTS